MSERFNLNYDPVRQGFDTNTWSTLLGDPEVLTSGRLRINTIPATGGSIIHYTDFKKGDINLNVNVPSTPSIGDIRDFGLSSSDSKNYIKFTIRSNTFKCATSNGGTIVLSDELEWNSTDWNGENINFQIIWEAGTAKFLIEGSNVYTVTGKSIPTGPLSLFLYDNSPDDITVGEMSIRGAQSMFPENSPSIGPGPA